MGTGSCLWIPGVVGPAALGLICSEVEMAAENLRLQSLWLACILGFNLNPWPFNIDYQGDTYLAVVSRRRLQLRARDTRQSLNPWSHKNLAHITPRRKKDPVFINMRNPIPQKV